MRQIITALLTWFLAFPVMAQTIDQQVDSLLNLMSLSEKVGQMTQVERNALEDINDLATYSIGSILSGGGSAPTSNTVQGWADMYDNFQSKALESNLGIPMVYGIDAVHGHNNVLGAVIFPHNIGMGCTWNPDLIEDAHEAIAREVAATGIDWTFAPCIAVPRNERWGRTYEGFGETVELQKMMGAAVVRGLQGDDLSSEETVLGCAKHFVGDGGTTDGTDQGNAMMSEEELRSVHMEGYIDAIEAGVGTVMASYNSWNGVKLHGHDYLLNEVLKTELGFEGFVISDWKGVDQVDSDYRTAIKQSINAGVDMVMVPDRYQEFIGHLISLVEDGEVSMERIDDAVKRILKQKFLLNLFEEPYANESVMGNFATEEHKAVAREVVRESMVLLSAKNEVLPLQKNDQTILVAGSMAADLGAQCGGWTIAWQGGNGDITPGTNILTGIENVAESSQIIHAPTGDYDGSTGDIDVAVVVIGEKTPYAEGGGDRLSLELDSEDVNLLKKLKAQGIPTVALLISGRPMVLGELLPYTDALFALWYPGTEGEGIAEVLFGDYQPTGKLSHSWPKAMWQVPINLGDDNYNPLFAYEHGLSDFPTQDTFNELLPYAATSNKTGDTITLALSDEITQMNANSNDFTVTINGVSNPVASLSVASFDESLLLLALSEPVTEEALVSLSYTGGSGAIAAADLALNDMEFFFVYNAAGAAPVMHSLPGRIQAEYFFEMSGIQTEVCTDVGSGENVGYIEPGDWMKYHVEVTETGTYNITTRIAGYNGGTLLLIFNDSTQAEVDYNGTNGWQSWQSFTSSIYLEAGTYVMQALAQSNAFNINYYDFELVTTGVLPQTTVLEKITVAPNPMQGQMTVTFASGVQQTVSIKLMDWTGKIVQELYEGQVKRGNNQFSFELNPNLPSGAYFMTIKDEKKRHFEKVVKE